MFLAERIIAAARFPVPDTLSPIEIHYSTLRAAVWLPAVDLFTVVQKLYRRDFPTNSFDVKESSPLARFAGEDTSGAVGGGI
jgi:hypothetical protein